MFSPGTTIDCITVNENTMQLRATGPEDPSQSSLTLDPAVISNGFKENGQDNVTSPGQGLFLVQISDY